LLYVLDNILEGNTIRGKRIPADLPGIFRKNGILILSGKWVCQQNCF